MNITALDRTILDWEDSFGNMVTIHDDDYNIIAANSSAIKLLNSTLSDILNKKCYRNYHGSSTPPKKCPSCDCLKSGKPSTVEIFEPHLKMHLEIKAFPRLDNSNAVKGVIHVVRDITARKQMENELTERVYELEQFYNMAVHREVRMKELKIEIERLRTSLSKYENIEHDS
ncbi:MAG: PAS domain-containing protein [Nitrospirae bacterium]|nr:PAS domain-containing protein [Nitrospirota bacterium]